MTKTKTKDSPSLNLSDKTENAVPAGAVQAGLDNLADMASQGPSEAIVEPSKKERKKWTRKSEQQELFKPQPLPLDPKITGQLLVIIGGIVARARHDEAWKPVESEILQFGQIMNAVLGRYLPEPAKKHEELVALVVFSVGYTMQRVTKKPDEKPSDSSLEEMKEKVHSFNV